MDSSLEYVDIFRGEIGKRVCDICQNQFDEEGVLLGLIVRIEGKNICYDCGNVKCSQCSEITHTKECYFCELCLCSKCEEKSDKHFRECVKCGIVWCHDSYDDCLKKTSSGSCFECGC